MTTPAGIAASNDHNTDRAVLVLLLFTLFLSIVYFLSFLDADLIRAGEARAAEIAREMVERNNFILPSLNHEVSAGTLTKPPLFHWLVAAVGSAFEWSNWAVRLPSVLAALGSIWMVFLIGRMLFGFRAATYSVVVLSTSILFLQNASASRIDILFTLLILFSLYSFWRALSDERQRRWIYGFYLCSGLAVVAKGPVGFLVPFAVALFHLFVSGRRTLIRELITARGLLLFFAVAVPWYVAMAVTAPPELVNNFLFGQLSHWWGGSSKMADSGGKSFFYYLPHLLVGAFPWSLFLPGIVVYGLREARRNGNAGLKSVLFWFLGGFVLFSLGGKKATRYLLPLMPAFALLAGFYWDRIAQGIGRGHRRVLIVAASLVLLGTVLVLALMSAVAMDFEPALNLLLRGRNPGGAQQVREGWDLLQGFAVIGLVVSLLSVAAALLGVYGSGKGRSAWIVAGSAAIAWTLVWPFSLGVKPQLDAAKSPRAAAETILQLLPEGAELYGGRGDKTYEHVMRWYLNRNITRESREQLYLRIRNERDSWVLLMDKNPPPEELFPGRAGIRSWQVDYYHITLVPGG